MTLNKRRKYDGEFKKDAIRLANEEGKRDCEVERSLGIPQGMIYRWRREFTEKGSLAFPGLGNEGHYAFFQSKKGHNSIIPR